MKEVKLYKITNRQDTYTLGYATDEETAKIVAYRLNGAYYETSLRNSILKEIGRHILRQEQRSRKISKWKLKD